MCWEGQKLRTGAYYYVFVYGRHQGQGCQAVQRYQRTNVISTLGNCSATRMNTQALSVSEYLLFVPFLQTSVQIQIQ